MLINLGKNTLALILVCVMSLGCTHDPEEQVITAKTSNSLDNLLATYNQLNWVMQPHGAEMALIWGDPLKGASGFMVRYPANWQGPPIAKGEPKMHMHTYGYSNVIISGQGKHWYEGQTEDEVPLLTKGDYFYQPGGQYHNESFNSDEPTIIYAVFDGPRDTFFDGVQVYP